MTSNKTPPRIHVLAKPTGATCNLDCSYCFFLDKELLYPGSRFRMIDEVLENYIRQLIESHRTNKVTVAWQGGEPTLTGIDFFRRVMVGKSLVAFAQELTVNRVNGDYPVEVYHFLRDEAGTNWKLVFMEQRQAGTLQIWFEPFVPLRIPKLFNLRTDPYERADITSNTYFDWFMDHAFLLIPSQRVVGQFLATFQEYPPRQKAASFTVDQVMEKLLQGVGST